MSMSRSDVNEIYTDGRIPLVEYDPAYGYVRIPDAKVAELEAERRRLVGEGSLTTGEARELARQVAEANERYARADAAIKERKGPDHYYGQAGMPVLVADRMAAGVC